MRSAIVTLALCAALSALPRPALAMDFKEAAEQ